MARLRWGLLSTASIGRVVVEACRSSQEAEFMAVASRDVGAARRFADGVGIALAFRSYDAMLASDDVDVVYVALPVSMHAEWTVKALRAGKHVLCEKPIAATADEVRACFDAAEQAGRQCVEGLMYRHHPQTRLARRLVSDGTIGQLATVRATLSVTVGEGDIRRSRSLDGGALNDLGCYCVSAIRLFAGSPRRISAEQVLDDAGLDLRMAATVRCADGALGQLDVGLDLPRREQLELVGTTGRLVLRDPWLCRLPSIELWRDDERELVEVDPDGRYGLAHDLSDAYRIEIDTVSEAMRTASPPPWGRADAVEQAATLEAVRRAARG